VRGSRRPAAVRKGHPAVRLSLYGLLRHLAAVERWWFAIQFAGGDDLPMLCYSGDDHDQDFDSLDGDVAETFAVWEAECRRSREIVARASPLDETGGRQRTGEPSRCAGHWCR
jgi:hypothetical protein